MSHYGRNNIWLTDIVPWTDLKTWSARTLYVYAHTDLAQKYSVGLQEIFFSRLCSQEENYFFPALRDIGKMLPYRIAFFLNILSNYMMKESEKLTEKYKNLYLVFYKFVE